MARPKTIKTEVHLETAGKHLVGKGKTLLDALWDLPRPDVIKLRGQVYAVKDGVKSKPVLLFPMQLRKMFDSSLSSREVHLIVLSKRLALI